MKRVKYIIIFGGIVLLMGAIHFIQETEEKEIKNAKSFLYIITDEGEAVIIGGGAGENMLIPREIDGIIISGVGEGAFQGRTDIKKVVVEQGVRYIAADAFADCTEIEKLELGEGLLYIGEGAFSGNNISELILPDSVAYVGEKAYADCSKLERVLFSQKTYVDAYAFVWSAWQEKRDEAGLIIRGSCLTGISDGPSSTLEIPYGITRTSDFSERADALIRQDIQYEEIIFPDTLIDLGKYCFWGTQIQKIHLPEGMKTINEGVFEEAVLGEIILPSRLERIKMGAFRESSIMEIKLPDTLEVIEPNAFWRSEGLKKITIPASVYYIGEDAFGGCTSIEEVVFEEGLQVVSGRAFAGVNVERIQFPESLMSIYGYGPYPEILERIYIPERTGNIDELFWRNFNESDFSIVIYGQSGSQAEKAAKEKGMEFVAVSNGNEMP